MAMKYIRHGATFNGDGTTSAEATVDGGVGAWNTITYYEGATPAYGAIGSGDIVNIRSKDAAGADITRSGATAFTFGSAAGTLAAPVTWILDNGVIWPGIDGTLTYSRTTPSLLGTVTQYNIIDCGRQDALVFYRTAGYMGDQAWLTVIGVIGKCLLDDSAKTDTYIESITIASMTSFYDTHFKVGSLGYSATDSYFSGTVFNRQTYRNIKLELTSAVNGTMPLFSSLSYYCKEHTLLCGKIYGAGAAGAFTLCTMNAGGSTPKRMRFIGMQIPITAVINDLDGINELDIIDADARMGGHYQRSWGYITSRTDNFPPLLSAALPDSVATKWAWRMYPKAASNTDPATSIASKVYGSAASVLNITQEILGATVMALHAGNTWVELTYVDAAGDTKRISTQDYSNGALTASTTLWSIEPPSWGIVQLTKYKFAITTPTAVKQDTQIMLAFFCSLASANANQILFIDPDFSVTA